MKRNLFSVLMLFALVLFTNNVMAQRYVGGYNAYAEVYDEEAIINVYCDMSGLDGGSPRIIIPFLKPIDFFITRNPNDFVLVTPNDKEGWVGIELDSFRWKAAGQPTYGWLYVLAWIDGADVATVYSVNVYIRPDYTE